MAEQKLPKLTTRVRFPSPAPRSAKFPIRTRNGLIGTPDRLILLAFRPEGDDERGTSVRKPIFTAIRNSRGKGFTQDEVTAVDALLDRLGVPEDEDESTGGHPAAEHALPGGPSASGGIGLSDPGQVLRFGEGAGALHLRPEAGPEGRARGHPRRGGRGPMAAVPSPPTRSPPPSMRRRRRCSRSARPSG